MNISFYKKVIKHFSRFSCRVILFIFLLFCHVSGNTFGSAPEQVKAAGNISLKLVAVSIPQGLAVLENKAGCVINYNKSIFNESSRINIDVKDVSLTQVLKQMLAGTHVGFKFADEHTVLLYKLPAPVKPGKISGKVLDEKGETLPGASVRIIETGNGTQTSVDGEYILSVAPGTYTLEVTYISYQTMRINGVVVTEDKNTPLNIALKPASSALKEVVVTASYRKASVDGLLTRQKNASEISNGISAEQLARTPDKNIGESLKRISGVSTIDNKFVLVRGIGERYNTAMLDGTILPSTEAQSRNFSFDMIPASLVDNVVVSKTITPDMNASFGGGLIQINTKDIPNENFMSFTAGASYNDQSTGKDFLSHKRGKYDYFGFDDGRRDFPKDLVHTNRNTDPNRALSDAEYQKKVVDQSKRFTNDNFTMYKYKTAPSQNYQFSIGRLLTLDTANNNKLGFTGAISYRNTQNINVIDDQSRGDWNIQRPDLNTGAAYVFNTTLGALLNVGLQLGNNRFSLRNTYTHVYDNTLTRIAGYDLVNGDGALKANQPPNRVLEADDPTYTTLLQNKLSGQHQLGKVKIEWDAARTSVSREEKDAGIASSRPVLVGDSYQYFYYGSKITEPRISETSRQHAFNKESHYSWNLSGTLPFTFAGIRSSVKAGYFGNQKNAEFNWQIAALATTEKYADSVGYKPIGQLISPENIAYDKYIYAIDPSFVDSYKGKSQIHAGYVMLDNRIFDKLRLVWGLRGEYYKYTEIKQGAIIKGGAENIFSVKPDKRWQWLPSANLTYSPIQSLNIRGAVSSSVVRPELMDNNPFLRYSPTLDALYGNKGLYSTRINSYDLKTEWFPGLGEIISVGGFYKRFDKPVELNAIMVNGNPNYYLQNADWANVYGLEFELRKNFGFIADEGILKNITAYGNLTLQKSTVQNTYTVDPGSGKPYIQVPTQQKRSLYGQSPYLYNLGLQYIGSHLGFNAAYNKSGRKTYIVSDDPTFIEYERPRDQLDIQISYRFLKNKMEVKFNMANLTNNIFNVYRNTASYEKIPGYTGEPGSDKSKGLRLKSGFSNNYEKGDQVMFQQRFGRTYSTSLTYNF
ncbi:TonB-dependent receptor [Mucilaginibacter lappiensis]|uniref:TonB-dependent receptor n=1 Tax=Mucilaginibacter lappiensis TaxID=354630 RepID=A0ABR6PGF5_9SPHI|nr:TonB-dependent receptor [Mucilaginibacter lappiensis]MBB6108344.1 TonB-dependent receptor [Mucilaginibacter lappiensis]SIQ41474.1 TonB-dependent receptor [Mucilaginibacter lappiensis]